MSKKRADEDNDPNWRNGIYVGQTNIGPATDVQEYRKYAEDLAKKGKEFLSFSEWRQKIRPKT
jgi:hypothetical protein